MPLTIERVMQLDAWARDLENAMPTLSQIPLTLIPISAPEMREFCRTWLELETRVKCLDADKERYKGQP